MIKGLNIMAKRLQYKEAIVNKVINHSIQERRNNNGRQKSF